MFRRLYGASPLHLLALVVTLLIAGAAVVGWFDAFPGPTAAKVVAWFVGAIVAHDLVLLPLYSLLDRITLGRPAARRSWIAYVRIPALLSGLLFLVFFPEILRLGDRAFFDASGFHQRVYLVRFLLSCAALFALSGVAYAISLVKRRQRAPSRTPPSRRRSPPAP